jgi:hypothetical protein
MKLSVWASASSLTQYLTATASMSLRTLSPASQPGLTVKSITAMAARSSKSLWWCLSTAWSHSSVTGQSAALLVSSSLSDMADAAAASEDCVHGAAVGARLTSPLRVREKGGCAARQKGVVVVSGMADGFVRGKHTRGGDAIDRRGSFRGGILIGRK